jgi:hypothetical protein
MKIFKDIWLRLRKTNGLPGNTVLVPMEEQKVPEVTEVKKVRKPRKKKETTNVTDAPKTE